MALLLAGVCEARPLNLAPVGPPIPGQGPVGLAIAETRGNTYAVVADYTGNQVRTLRLDRATGLLAPVGSVPLANGPSALAVTADGRHVLATSLGGSTVTSFSLDPATGLLRPVSTASSGGNGPVNLDMTNDGYVVIANKDSDSLGVLRLDPRTGLLAPVGTTRVGDAPNDVKITGRQVIVGHAISKDVHLLHLDRFGALYPLDVRPVGTSEVSSIAVFGPIAVAGTFPAGEVHAFLVGPRRLTPLGSVATGSDITDLTISDRGTLFVAGGLPGRVTAFELDRRLRLQQVGTLSLPGFPTSRTLATVRGRGQETWVIANEYRGNQTLVISAKP